MKSCFIFIAFVSLLCSCTRSLSVSDTDILVKVKEQTLSRSEVESRIPKGLTSADSLLLAESYVRKWVKDALMYEVASRNLNDEKAEIDKLVEDYRHSLVKYRYQERLVKEKLSVIARENEKREYYEENRKKFLLDKSLIKGLFLKVPVDAPGISDVKSWYKSNTEASLEKIEKYSIQNAVIYEYFYDRWVEFYDVMDNIPLPVANTNQFLRTNKFVEVADSSYYYLLNIQDYLLAGSEAPFEYAETQIVEQLTNQKKIEFLRTFEEELYKDAIRRGDVIFNSEP
ncbi:MAG: peptidyl-prolyl cis-trans isomerase [Tannerellaceae bacterium]|nr:peptidyl-prolyl cis-trans isomerase [Tannerellaceae bacterium]